MDWWKNLSKSSVRKNYIYNIIYQILLIILPIITQPYIARVLGAESVGIYNYTNAVVTAFTIFAVLGSNSFAIREIAYAQNNRHKQSILFWETVILRCFTSLICILIYVPYIVTTEYTAVYLAAITNLIYVPLDISWFFQGIENFKKTVFQSFIFKLIAVILIFLFVKSPDDVAIYTMIVGITSIMGLWVLWLSLHQYIEKISIKELAPFRHFKSVLIFFIPTASTYIYTSLDKVVLGILSTKVEVGYYSQSEKIVKLLVTVITALSTVLMPRMAFLIKSGKLEEVKKNINNSYRFVFFIAFPMILGLSCISDCFIPLFLGDGYDKCVMLIRLLVPLILIMGVSSMTGTTVMIAMGMQKKYNIIIVSASVINLILNLILVKNWASVGVSVATIIAEGFVCVSEVNSIKGFLDKNDLIKDMCRYLINSIIMGAFIYFIHQYMDSNWTSIIVMVISGVVFYGLLLFIERDKFLLSLIRKK